MTGQARCYRCGAPSPLFELTISTRTREHTSKTTDICVTCALPVVAVINAAIDAERQRADGEFDVELRTMLERAQDEP